MVKLKLPTNINQFSLTCFMGKQFNITLKHFLDLPLINIYEGLNYIKILSPDEPKHSRIIGSLLDPRGQHGLEKKFLSAFFTKVLSDDKFIDENTDKWNVTIEKEKYDIRIRNQNNTKIIILENKAKGAIDQPNQLYRYWFKGLFLRQNQNIDNTYSKILYISPDFGTKHDSQTTTRPKDWDCNLPEQIPDGIVKVVYFRREIYIWLEECLNCVDVKINPELHYHIKQYKDFWG
jgi:hypothetical protein